MNERAGGGVWRGAGLVAAVYVYFLIFAEFAFLELARSATGDGGLRIVMGALGAGGVAGSAWAARGFVREGFGARLGVWLLGCAGAAAAAIIAPRAGVAWLAATGAGAGFSLGGATVTLAAGLRAVTGARRLGLAIGLGTGAAYGFCNLPFVFAAGPASQSAWAVAAVSAGAILARRAAAREEEGVAALAAGVRGVGGWVVVFLALVWMDSAAFYIIQHTEALKAATWSGAWTLGGNAAAHLGVALLAGLLLDRGRAGWTSAAAALLLAAACLWITSAGAELLYVAGVSLYSVALVHAPARTGDPRAAALIYAVAGWGGSALGIGMAQDLHRVPEWFSVSAPAAVGAGLLWRRRAGGAALALVFCALSGGWATDARAEGEAILRGREVYVAEGCIHCHSQYVRPGTEDVVRWGPARPLEELLRAEPPLFGNRRQGPDLLNVGNRRSREWNRLHLVAPRAVSPGSRMPSYARLFEAGGRKGEALLDYIDSLGADTLSERAGQVAGWRPAEGARVDAALGRRWYARSCAQCHGPEGGGDGPLARALSAPPPDLRRGTALDEAGLARLIKFGRPGTPMAGHEALDDAAVVSLAAHVRGLHKPEQTSR